MLVLRISRRSLRSLLEMRVVGTVPLSSHCELDFRQLHPERAEHLFSYMDQYTDEHLGADNVGPLRFFFKPKTRIFR